MGVNLIHRSESDHVRCKGGKPQVTAGINERTQPRQTGLMSNHDTASSINGAHADVSVMPYKMGSTM
jgi:hypothetical protein